MKLHYLYATLTLQIIFLCSPISIGTIESGNKIGVLQAVKKISANTLLNHAHNIDIKNIIFDLHGVLFRTSKSFMLGEIGIFKMLKYALTSKKSPFALEETINDFFKQVCPSSPKHTHKGKPIPSLICDWQVGKLTSKQLKEKFITAIERLHLEDFFESTTEKEIVTKIIHTVFTPELFVRKSLRPLSKGLKLLRTLRNKKDNSGNYKHKIYLLSNFDKESFEILKNKYPQVFDLFDGIMISGDVECMKPDNTIYEKLLKTYDLQPHECFFMDDEHSNVKASLALGIPSMQFCN